MKTKGFQFRIEMPENHVHVFACQQLKSLKAIAQKKKGFGH